MLSRLEDRIVKGITGSIGMPHDATDKKKAIKCIYVLDQLADKLREEHAVGVKKKPVEKETLANNLSRSMTKLTEPECELFCMMLGRMKVMEPSLRDVCDKLIYDVNVVNNVDNDSDVCASHAVATDGMYEDIVLTFNEYRALRSGISVALSNELVDEFEMRHLDSVYTRLTKVLHAKGHKIRVYKESDTNKPELSESFVENVRKIAEECARKEITIAKEELRAYIKEISSQPDKVPEPSDGESLKKRNYKEEILMDMLQPPTHSCDLETVEDLVRDVGREGHVCRLKLYRVVEEK